jgi:predicted flap endonuclease-1-like 5' DNA nuclease
MPKPDIAEKAKSTYVSFKKQTPKLNQSVIASGRLDMPDDPTKIEGIGPYIEERLNNIGIYNYDQISKLEVSDIRIITELIEFFPGRIERDNWVKQANALILYRSKL